MTQGLEVVAGLACSLVLAAVPVAAQLLPPPTSRCRSESQSVTIRTLSLLLAALPLRTAAIEMPSASSLAIAW